MENTVNEIRHNVDPSFWSHCPQRSNPADLPSRGITNLEVSVNQLWQRGPEWLFTGIEPCMKTGPLSIPDECTIELRIRAARAVTLVNVNSRCNVSVLIDCKKFGTLTKLLSVRVTAQVLRAIEKFKKGRNRRIVNSPQ